MSNMVSAVRAQNMDLRRHRIRDAARDLLISEGLNALTTRKLAAAAGVTVPTVYNLIGPVEDVLASLIEDGVDKIQVELNEIDVSLDGLALAEKVVTVSIDVFTQDARAFKAIGLAAELEALTKGPNPAASVVIERCVGLQLKAVRRAQEQGDLEGKVDPRYLAELILMIFRQAYRDWSRGAIKDDVFRARALHGLFICLLSDAASGSSGRLQKRLRAAEKALAAPDAN